METSDGSQYKNEGTVMFALTVNGRLILTSSKVGQAHVYNSRRNAEFMAALAKKMQNLDCKIEEVLVVKRMGS